MAIASSRARLLAYDGTGFRGWAGQRERIRTVEGVLRTRSDVLGSGRQALGRGADRRGRARPGQVVSFATGAETVDPQRVREARERRCSGRRSSCDGRRRRRRGFDARFSATGREYVYRMDTGDVAGSVPATVRMASAGSAHVGAMRRAAALPRRGARLRVVLPGAGGRADRRFGTPTRSPCGGRASGSRSGRADGFLHQMVRSLVGTLVEVGEGGSTRMRSVATLEALDRAAARQVAPPHGLTLERVIYGRPVRETTGG